MVTRTEVLQQRRGKDTVSQFDLNLILDYYDEVSGTTDVAARAAILTNQRAVDFFHPADLEALHDYVALVNGTRLSSNSQAFKQAIPIQKQGVSREMLGRVLDEMAFAVPFSSNLQAWHDFSDLSTIQGFVSGLPPVADNERIDFITNKGNDVELDLDDGDNDTPAISLAGGPNGTGYMFADGVQHGNSADLRNANPPTVSGAGGMAVFVVQAKIGAISTLGDHEWRWHDNVAFTPALSHFITADRFEFNGFSETVDLGGGVVEDEFHVAFFSISSSDSNLYTGRSGQSIVTTPAVTYTQVATGNHYNLVVEESAISECLMYDRGLDLTEIATVLAYFDAKYGTLPQVVTAP